MSTTACSVEFQRRRRIQPPMPSNYSAAIVQRLWNYCNVLRDDGISDGDYVEQVTYAAAVDSEAGVRGQAGAAEPQR